MTELFQKPFDTKNQEDIINRILSDFPFVSKSIIGKSVLKNEIISLKVGSDTKKMIMVAGTHGSEWLTSGLLLYFLYNICKAISTNEKLSNININEIIKYKGFVIVPCLNPDGVNIAIHKSEKYNKIFYNPYSGSDVWQSNARGVDINHNFPAGYDELKRLEVKNKITVPSNSRYGGKFAASEPETKAIMEFCRKNNFTHLISFHSQGEEIYWRYGEKIPQKSLEMANIFSKSSGYRISDPEGLAVGGGLKDWFIEEFEKPAFTVEIGKGKNPLPLSDLFKIYKQLQQMLILAAVM